MTLLEALPELVGDVVGALIREGRGSVADQLPNAGLRAWTFDEFAQATYLHLAATRDPTGVEETISLGEFGIILDLGRDGQVLGLEVVGYEESLSRLGSDIAAQLNR